LGCLDGIVFLATGNVLAVSLHQDSSSSSDIRLQVQLEAYTASAGFVPPAMPVSFMAGNATTESIILEWEEADDTNFYVLERKLSSDVAYSVLADNIPGTFSGYLDERDLEDGMEYIYRLTATSLGGTSDCVESNLIMTEADETPILVRHCIG
jgi:hypothetical protein